MAMVHFVGEEEVNEEITRMLGGGNVGGGKDFREWLARGGRLLAND
jgi:hypothetical protein